MRSQASAPGTSRIVCGQRDAQARGARVLRELGGAEGSRSQHAWRKTHELHQLADPNGQCHSLRPYGLRPTPLWAVRDTSYWARQARSRSLINERHACIWGTRSR